MQEANSIIRVKVFPGSKKEKFVRNADGSFEIYVREPAQNNLANARVRERIAQHFKVSTPRVLIQTGHRARKKGLIITQTKS